MFSNQNSLFQSKVSPLPAPPDRTCCGQKACTQGKCTLFFLLRTQWFLILPGLEGTGEEGEQNTSYLMVPWSGGFTLCLAALQGCLSRGHFLVLSNLGPGLCIFTLATVSSTAPRRLVIYFALHAAEDPPTL